MKASWSPFETRGPRRSSRRVAGNFPNPPPELVAESSLKHVGDVWEQVRTWAGRHIAFAALAPASVRRRYWQTAILVPWLSRSR